MSAGNVDEAAISDMEATRQIIEKGLSLRMQNDEYGLIKVRQPLPTVAYPTSKLSDFFEQIIAEELNVKRL